MNLIVSSLAVLQMSLSLDLGHNSSDCRAFSLDFASFEVHFVAPSLVIHTLFHRCALLYRIAFLLFIELSFFKFSMIN